MKSENVSKLSAKCVEIQTKHTDRSVCVYDNGTLAALRSGTGWNYESSEYSSFEKAQLPGRIRGIENGKPVFELRMNAAQAGPAGIDVRGAVTHRTLIRGGSQGLTCRG